MNRAIQGVFRYARRLIVLVVGTTVLVIGLILLVTPGPAVVVIPIGLAILSIEFVWARRLLKRARSYFEKREAPGACSGAIPQGNAASGDQRNK